MSNEPNTTPPPQAVWLIDGRTLELTGNSIFLTDEGNGSYYQMFGNDAASVINTIAALTARNAALESLSHAGYRLAVWTKKDLVSGDIAAWLIKLCELAVEYEAAHDAIIGAGPQESEQERQKRLRLLLNAPQLAEASQELIAAVTQYLKDGAWTFEASHKRLTNAQAHVGRLLAEMDGTQEGEING